MLIIDGHNLAFADDAARDLLECGDPDGARRRILQLVKDYTTPTRQRASVVFDGAGGEVPRSTAGWVRFCFSGPGRTADTEILRIISSSTGRREICLVTNDHSLATAARTLGAKTLGTSEFLKEAARVQRRKAEDAPPEPAGKHHGAPPDEVDYWLSVFSDDDVAAAEKEQYPERKKRGK